MRLSLIGAVAVLIAGVASTANAQVKVLTYDGDWGDALAAAISTSPDLPVIVERYDGSLDAAASTASLVDAETDAANLMCDDGPAQPVDPSLAQAFPRSLTPDVMHQCGVGYLVTSLVLATRSDGPDDWAAFFDAERFPGARALPRGARGTLEIALMADGVALADVYALLETSEGITRALDKLDALFTQAQIVFWDTPDDAVALLRADAVAAAALPSVHAAHIVQQDQQELDTSSAFQISFAGQIYRVQRLVVLPAATSDQETVRHLLTTVLSADGQASLAAALLAGPVNPQAWDMMPASLAPLLPTAPSHDIAVTGLADNADFWTDHGDDIEVQFATWLDAHEQGPSPALP